MTHVLLTHISMIVDGAVHQHEDTFFKVLKDILDGDSFKIMSPTAIEARKVAVDLVEWCISDINKQHFETFIKTFFNSLQKLLILCSRRSCNREILWRNYFLVRSSKEFITNWVTFLKDAKLTATPIFYQHMTDLVFRDLIQSHFVGSSNNSTPETAVSSHEAGALRYAAGYVCRHLCKKLNVRTTNLRRKLCFV